MMMLPDQFFDLIEAKRQAQATALAQAQAEQEAEQNCQKLPAPSIAEFFRGWNLAKAPKVKTVLSINPNVMPQQRRKIAQVFILHGHPIRPQLFDASLKMHCIPAHDGC
jgi:hypothetical protein